VATLTFYAVAASGDVIGSTTCRLCRAAHFNCVETEENVVLSLVPMPLTAATITMEIPAAIRAYSIAVAAVWSSKKDLSFSTMPRVVSNKL